MQPRVRLLAWNADRPSRLVSTVRVVEWILSALAATILMAMMLLTVSDVLLRYLFNAPIKQAYDLTEVGLAILIFVGLPIVSLRGVHVTTDLIDGLLSESSRRTVQRIVDVICALAAYALGYLLINRAVSMAESNARMPVANIELSPLAYLMALLLGLTASMHLLRAIWPSIAEPISKDPNSGNGPGL